MTSAVLIPGAGGLGWYWHLVERDLQDRGYDAVAVDLAARGRTGLPAYADAVVEAIPQPGETPGEWWENVGSEQARKAAAARDGYSPEFDLTTYFMHDIPQGLVAEMLEHGASQLDESFDDACTFDSWPPIPIHVVAGRDDRFFPLELQQRIARERLGIDPVIVPGGHLAALSHPEELTAVLAGLLGPV